MATGLLAILDDIATLTKASAASLDDIAAGAVKASSKTTAIIIDDMAVTPQYTDGLAAEREFPIVVKITLGSLINKFFIVIPIIMVLSAVAEWVLPFFLIVGGSYLTYEGMEKVLAFFGLVNEHTSEEVRDKSPAELEKKTVSAAVRTDLVLSFEIMLVALTSVELPNNWVSELLMLLMIAVAMTILVYGVVAILVKMDDLGLRWARKDRRWLRLTGLTILRAMPKIFDFLSIVGTLAMLWVGGHLAWKNLGETGLGFFATSLHWLESFVAPAGPILAWCGETLGAVGFGCLLGTLLVYAVFGIKKLIHRFSKGKEN